MRVLCSGAAAVLVAVCTGCLNVHPVDISPKLEKPEDRVTPTMKGVSVAVLNYLPPQEVQVDGSGGDAAMKESAPPPPVDPNPRTRVTYTPKYQEAYPTVTHMDAAIPEALREHGFDVVTVSSAEEARQRGVGFLLRLQPPEIEGFRRAQGGGLRLEGTVMDVHVTYRGELVPSSGLPLGVMNGHGESTTNFFFDDTYLEAAVVGAISLVAMALTTAAVSVPVAAATFQCVKSQRGPCSEDRQILLVGVGALSVIIFTAAASLGLAQLVGATLFAGTTAIIKSYASEPIWTDMLKTAHDKAARGLAAQMALAVTNARNNANRGKP